MRRANLLHLHPFPLRVQDEVFGVPLQVEWGQGIPLQVEWEQGAPLQVEWGQGLGSVVGAEEGPGPQPFLPSTPSRPCKRGCRVASDLYTLERSDGLLLK